MLVYNRHLLIAKETKNKGREEASERKTMIQANLTRGDPGMNVICTCCRPRALPPSNGHWFSLSMNLTARKGVYT